MNDETTWEERMSQRARERMAAEAAAEAAEYKRSPEYLAHVAGHETHHVHLEGTMVVCSCGRFEGITCVAIDDDPTPWYCEVCGKKWATLLGEPTRAPL